MQYPEKCIRGILKPDFIDEDGVANINLFQFQKREPLDGWSESSINWMDDGKAIGLTLDQTKLNGELRYELGIATLLRSDLDRIKKRHGFANCFNYERAPIENNRYHGNLLLKDNILPTRKKMARNLLAFSAQIHYREAIINQSKNNPRWFVFVMCLVKRCRNFIFSSLK